jgi:two-component system response regulator FixJ
MANQTENKITVYLIEDDISQRESLESLLNFKGYIVKSFKSAKDFLNTRNIERPAILISDIHLPDQSGVDLHKVLLKHNLDFPVIFISGESTIQQSVDAMKQGAIEFLVKPFDINDLLNAIDKSINIEIKRMNLNLLLKRLSPRENEVYGLLIEGLNNSELMAKLSLSLPTIKQYKSAVMRKLEVKTLFELIGLSK